MARELVVYFSSKVQKQRKKKTVVITIMEMAIIPIKVIIEIRDLNNNWIESKYLCTKSMCINNRENLKFKKIFTFKTVNKIKVLIIQILTKILRIIKFS